MEERWEGWNIEYDLNEPESYLKNYSWTLSRRGIRRKEETPTRRDWWRVIFLPFPVLLAHFDSFLHLFTQHLSFFWFLSNYDSLGYFTLCLRCHKRIHLEGTKVERFSRHIPSVNLTPTLCHCLSIPLPLIPTDSLLPSASLEKSSNNFIQMRW